MILLLQLQGLFFAKSLLRKLTGGVELPSSYERSRDTDDTSSDAGSSSVGSQSTDELSELLSQTDTWLGRAELLQSLLGSGIAASLDDIADGDSSARLRDRLIVEERYSMAVYTSKKCKVDNLPGSLLTIGTLKFQLLTLASYRLMSFRYGMLGDMH